MRYEQELRAIIQKSASLRSALEAVRDCAPPNWLVGAGVVRNAVWDVLHHHAIPTPAADVDVAFYDPTDLRPAYAQRLEAELDRRLPGRAWEVTNQAGVHHWYEQRFGFPVPPLTSVEDAIATWPETASCVGVRLLANDDLLVVAPFGLDDLFQMLWRHNPRRVSVEEFRRRLTQKAIQQTWPLVRVIDP